MGFARMWVNHRCVDSLLINKSPALDPSLEVSLNNVTFILFYNF